MSDKDDEIVTGVGRRRLTDRSKRMEPWQVVLLTVCSIAAFTYLFNSMYSLYMLHEAQQDALEAVANFQKTMADADARTEQAIRQDQVRQQQEEVIARVQAEQRQIVEAKRADDWRRCTELKAIPPARQSLAEHASMAQSCADVGVPFE